MLLKMILLSRCKNDCCKLESWQYIIIKTVINFQFHPSNLYKDLTDVYIMNNNDVGKTFIKLSFTEEINYFQQEFDARLFLMDLIWYEISRE